MGPRNATGVEQAAQHLQTLTDLPGSTLTKYAAALKRVADNMDRANEVLAKMPAGSRRNLFRRDGKLAAPLGERIDLETGAAIETGESKGCFDSLDLEWHNGALTPFGRKLEVYFLERPLRIPFERAQFLEALANEPKVAAALNSRLKMLIKGIEEELRSLAEVAGKIGAED